jgi:hypothetical protein
MSTHGLRKTEEGEETSNTLTHPGPEYGIENSTPLLTSTNKSQEETPTSKMWANTGFLTKQKWVRYDQPTHKGAVVVRLDDGRLLEVRLEAHLRKDGNLRIATAKVREVVADTDALTHLILKKCRRDPERVWSIRYVQQLFRGTFKSADIRAGVEALVADGKAEWAHTPDEVKQVRWKREYFKLA